MAGVQTMTASRPISGRFLLNRGRARLSTEELDALEAAFDPPVRVPARNTLITKGDTVTRSTILIEGTMCRFLDDRQGHRQLLGVHISGDFVDLHGFPLHRLDHDVAAISDCLIASMPHDKLRELTLAYPDLAHAFWRSTMFDAAMHREWIFRLGRLSAQGRVAHFFAEMAVRSELVGIGDGREFPLAINQMDLAEACGLTPVHVNRTLRLLRERDILTFRGGIVSIADIRLLHREADFDGNYIFPNEE